MGIILQLLRGRAKVESARKNTRKNKVSAIFTAGWRALEPLENRILLSGISSGQTLSGTIATGGQQDTYTFTATAGQSFQLSLGAASSSSTFLPDLSIFDPHGTRVFNSYTGAAHSSVVGVYHVPSTGAGTYTAVVEADTATNTGAYALELAAAPAAQAADADGDGGTIASGQTQTGLINRPGDLDVFTFNATAGQTFQLSLGAASSSSTFLPYMFIYDPNGTQVYNSYTGAAHSSIVGVYHVPSTGAGTYTAVVEADTATNTGAYALELASAPATQAADADGDGGTIASGQTIPGLINRAGDLDVFTFNATAGQTFQLSLGAASSSSTFLPYMFIYDPNGTQVYNSYTGAAHSSIVGVYHVPSTGAGTYTAVVEADTATNTGAYALELASSPATQAVDADGDGGVIASGQTKTGLINRAGDLDVFTFSAAAGQTFQLSLGVAGSSSTFLPYLFIYDPNGTQVVFYSYTGAADSSVVAVYHVPSTGGGTYTAVVEGETATNTGAYALELASSPATQVTDADGDGGVIASGQTKTGLINRPGDLDVFTFAATAGQTFQLSLGVASSSSTFLPYLFIYDPNGTQVFSNYTGNADASISGVYHVPSTGAGVYTAVVEAETATNTGAYALELASAPATQSTDADGDGGTIVSGQTKTGQINRAGDLDVFTFNATAGQTFQLSLGVASSSSTFLPELTIYDPNGTQVFNNYTGTADASISGVYHVPSTGAGVYTAVIQGENGRNTGDYALELASAPATQATDADGDGGTIASGQMKTGLINRPGDLDIFTFAATAGDIFGMTLGVASSSSTFLPQLTIYDPNGTQVFNNYTGAADSSISSTYHVPSTGTGVYTAVVQGENGRNTGDYVLSLNGATVTATAVTPSLTVNNGTPNGASPDAVTKEDEDVVVPVVATLGAGASVNEVLTVTVTGISAAAGTFSCPVGTYDAVHGTWTVTLPADTNLNTSFTFTPIPNSDVDFGSMHATASAFEPASSTTAVSSTDFYVTVDAVADVPTITVHDAAGAVDSAIAVSLSGALTDTDGSETITGYQISGVPVGFSFNHGTDQGSGVWAFAPADLSGLTMSSTAGFSGAIDLTATVMNAETNLSGKEVDPTDNTNSASGPFTVTWQTVSGPTVTINQAVGQSDPATTSPIRFTVVFSEAVSDFVTGDVSFTGSTAGGTLVGTVTGSGTTYTVAVTGMTTSGTVVASIGAGEATDLAGNASTASTSTDNSVVFNLPETPPPVLTTTADALNYAQGSGAAAIDPGIKLTDPGSATITSATVQITQNFAAAEDMLGFTNQGGITGSFANGTLTLTGSATVAQYQAALRSVTYADTSTTAASVLPRTISFTVTDASNHTSNTATRALTLNLFGTTTTGKNVTLTLTDTDGTQATFALAGGGSAEVTTTVGENGKQFFNLTITGSSAKSAVSINSKALKQSGSGGGGNGMILLDSVTILSSAAPAVRPLTTSDSMQALAHPAAASPVALKSFTATNGVLVGTFEVEGAIQTITIGEVSGGMIKIDAPPAGLTVAPLVLTIPLDVNNGSIDSAIPIKSIKTVDWTDDGAPDFIKASEIGTITTTGNKKTGSNGDFQADVAGEDDTDGNPTPTTLGSAKIAGSLTGSTWNLTGVTTAIQVGGDLGDADNAVTIAAVSIKSLKVGGDLDHATINLSQAIIAGSPKTTALGSLTVGGTLKNSTITSAGIVSAVTLGAMDSSQLLVGNGGAPGLVSDPNVFTPHPDGPSLASFTIKGVAAGQSSLTDSIIDAWNIGKANLKLVGDAGAAAAPFGFAADKIASLTFQNGGVNGGKPVTLKNLDTSESLDEELADPKRDPALFDLSSLSGGFTLHVV